MPQRWRASREAMEMVIEQQRSAKSQRLPRSRGAGAPRSQGEILMSDECQEKLVACAQGSEARNGLVERRGEPVSRFLKAKASGAKTLASDDAD